MPSSIFPDIPSSRRSFDARPKVGPPFVPPTSISSYRPSMSRRHTAHLMPAPPVPGPRRESRPLRSSPLAGPAIALSTDGTLLRPDEDGAARTMRYRPNRISSTPDVGSAFSTEDMNMKKRLIASAPTSPTGTLRGNPLPPLTAEPEPLMPSPVKEQEEKTPLVSAEPAKSSRRLSISFKRLSYSLPLSNHKRSPSGSTSTTAPATEETPVLGRARTFSGPPSPNGVQKDKAPPVPAIPVWAKPSFMSTPSSSHVSSSSVIDISHTPDAPSSRSLARRPSTAPSTSSAVSAASTSRLSTRRRSVRPDVTIASSSLPHLPGSNISPSTSRDPEMNWLSTAAAPKFSRLGLKAEGVVMPVSAKSARRRSTMSVLSAVSESEGVRSMKSRESLRSVASGTSKSGKGKEKEKPVSEETAKRTLESAAEEDGDVEPPSPPFMRNGNASSSSLVTSSTSGSIGTLVSSVGSIGSMEEGMSTPSLTSSTTRGSVDELGVLSDSASAATAGGMSRLKDHGMAATRGVELRVNDVTVEIIDMGHQHHRRDSSQGSVRGVPNAAVHATEKPVVHGGHKDAKAGKEPKRSGTLKRMWRKVTGGAKS
ncbi:hypothetical protein PHLCEN_2v2701 [Hermanssonia centrifuga]|uniref:Uncharacterized protein n=1 Tax=Hermanssonia centrifuga TaxID=98765 RepID=A0A2R6RIG7_9APHY|nr:hypothetical protein PHLCEN_2v2701 [Hermanssonia centrifuga]